MGLDRVEFCVRFVFGLVAGTAVGGWVFLSVGIQSHSLPGTLALFAVPALVCAFLVGKFGGRFFEWFFGGLW